MAFQVRQSYSTQALPLQADHRQVWPPLMVRCPAEQGGIMTQMRVTTVDGDENFLNKDEMLLYYMTVSSNSSDKHLVPFSPILRPSAIGHWVGLEIIFYNKTGADGEAKWNEMYTLCFKEAWVGEHNQDFLIKLARRSQEFSNISDGNPTPSISPSLPPPNIRYSPFQCAVTKGSDSFHGTGYIIGGQIHFWNFSGPDITSNLETKLVSDPSPFNRQVRNPQHVCDDGYS
ncbi:hypothetical protein F66182_10411, partial [Fusarium sp. NRRL 66182]